MNKSVFDLTGISALHEKNVLGQGVSILVHERDSNSEHAYMTENVIRQIAPLATIKRWSHGPMTINEDMSAEYAKGYDLINRSFSGDHVIDDSTTKAIVLSASGNSEDTISLDVRDPNVIGVGAVTLATNGKVYRELCGWDDLGMPLEQSVEVMGFDNLMTSEGFYPGTSCATPFVTGLLALIASDYKAKGITFDLKTARMWLHTLAVKSILKPNHSVSHDQNTGLKSVVGYDSEIETDVRKIGMGYASLVGYISPVVDKPKDNTIKLQIGNNIMTVYGEERVIPTPPQIINGNTMLPLKAIAEALGLMVKWDRKTKTVTLERGDK